ncbi:MAG: peptidase M22 [Oscillospiraceae bacterium]|nr:peptidase M22 [Oscillospiraceae bacterium]MBQ2861592.1 peptidase M22 [Oscillospiraceae bacterium]MBQ2998295.1 peptidase M22 [Oscillospiraceae bacterium]MBQ3560807.1 peptidase M22 [Oscillospiraceae bacterium]
MFLGIDTSNYTTSAALYDFEKDEIIQVKKLLPVKEGELGLRQSDAVFSHVKQLGGIVEELFGKNKYKIDAIGVSTRPRDIDGSYMPCFLVGDMVADTLSSVIKVPRYEFSHQQGHIAAALFSAKRLDLLKEKFIAFHLSGGTTEALLVTPDENRIIKCEKIAGSADLKAGQAVDRVGVMLGLPFPAGKHLEELALKSTAKYKIKPTMKGSECCLSGIENKCRKMLDSKEKPEDIALFCLKSIEAALCGMTDALLEEYGKIPLIYAGGVMSNKIIRKTIEEKYSGIFAKPEFSSDNAAGIAVLASVADKK